LILEIIIKSILLEAIHILEHIGINILWDIIWGHGIILHATIEHLWIHELVHHGVNEPIHALSHYIWVDAHKLIVIIHIIGVSISIRLLTSIRQLLFLHQ